MLQRFGIEYEPVRHLLNEYLLERAPSLDHTTLRGLAATLGRLFWRDLEIHHPGISSLNLAPDVAAAWKQRILLKITRATGPGGQVIETHDLRSNGRAELSRSAPSTSTSPSGRWRNPPAGVPGRHPRRCAAKTWPG